MRKVISTLLVAMAFLLSATAQDRTISGRVLDEKGNPIDGISVLVQGANTGTSTKADGTFSISAAPSAMIIFSGVNFERLTLRASSISNSVVLKGKNNPMDEIVVTGYQARKKRDEVGAISSIKAAQLENLPAVSLDKAMQGKAAGVLVQSNNGIPGGSVNVRIRGEASILAGNTPLYIVDGQQINTRNDAAFTQSNPLAFLNPDDIETIDILKDAASSAIYGSAASNGVVIVTTKRGRSGKTKFAVNSSVGFVNPLKKLDVLNSQEFYQLRAEAVGNANNLAANNLAVKQNVLTLFRVPGAASLTSAQADSVVGALPTYDWQDAAIRQGALRTLSISASGGNDKTTFRVSASTEYQQTFITKADFKRYGLKLDLTNKATERLNINTSLSVSSIYQNNPFATDGSTLGNAAFAASAILPVNPFRNADGSYYGVPGAPIANLIGTLNQNILAVNEWRTGFTRNNQLVGNVGADYRLASWLTLRGLVGLDYRMIQGKNVTDARTPDGFARKGLVQVQSNWNTNINTFLTLNFNKTFHEKHRIDGLVGTEYRKENNEFLNASGDGFPTYEFVALSSAANALSVGESKSGYKKVGFFGNVNYSYDSKYLIGITGRYDGSSRFGLNNKFGAFYGVKAGWNIDREAFIKNSKVISQLRIRAGVGSTGSDQINDFASLGTFTSGFIYNGNPGTQFNQLANPDLKWERSTVSNLGVDFGFFDNRINGAVEVYKKKTDAVLFSQPLQSTTGFSSFTSNIGKNENKGVELTLNVDILRSKKVGGFNWNTTFIFAYNKATVKELYGGYQILPSNPSIRVGQPNGVLFTQQYAGVNASTGRPMFYDTLGNLTYQVAAKDRRLIGPTLLSPYQGGLTNRFSYKGFSMEVFFNYEYGRYAQDLQVAFLSENLARINTLQYFYDNRWTTPGQITDVARPNSVGAETKGSGAQSGTRTWFKADYIRLKTMTLAYDFAAADIVGKKLGVSSARVYIQGTNLFTYSDSFGYDVEFVGTATGIIPQSRVITAGVQIGF